MPQVRHKGPRHHTKDDIGRIRLHGPLKPFGPVLVTVRRPQLRRLWLCKPFIQELAPQVPMKSVVFGDGLLFMAFTGPGKIQHGTVDRLPLLLQTEAIVSRAASLPAVLPIRGPRQSDVDLRAAKTRMTTPTETEARPRARRQAATTAGVSCRRRRAWKFQSADPTDHP